MSARQSLFSLIEKLELHPNSCIMLHGNLAIIKQFDSFDEPSKQEFVNLLLDFFSPLGTVIVPVFTYSAAVGEIFSPNNSVSKIGAFSESFRTSPRMMRTCHPNFSCMIYGREKELFMRSSVEDAFGKGTIFDKLFDKNGHIVSFGSPINSTITFTHYVEQLVGVPYRYMKSFQARIDDDCSVNQVFTNYYVRKMDEDLDTEIDLNKFRTRAITAGILKIAPFGRLECFAIRSQDCFTLMKQMLLEDPISLIKGFRNS